jgi:hypothetical protein
VACPRICPHSHLHIWVVVHLKGCHLSPFHRQATLARHLEVCRPFHHQVAWACRLGDHLEARLADILLDRRDVRSNLMRRGEFYLFLTVISIDLHLTAEEQRGRERMKKIYPMCLRGVGEEESLIQLPQAQMLCCRQGSSGRSCRHSRLAVSTNGHKTGPCRCLLHSRGASSRSQSM